MRRSRVWVSASDLAYYLPKWERAAFGAALFRRDQEGGLRMMGRSSCAGSSAESGNQFHILDARRAFHA